MDRGGRLVWSADEQALLFSAHFDAKPCRDNFQHQSSCDLAKYSVVFQSSFVRSLLLDPYGGNDPDETLSLFYKQVASKLPVILGIWLREAVFRHVQD